MSSFVSLRDVDNLLRKHGYRERKSARRRFPDATGTWFVLYEKDRSLMIGFPTRGGKVLRQHFERICLVIELHGNGHHENN